MTVGTVATGKGAVGRTGVGADMIAGVKIRGKGRTTLINGAGAYEGAYKGRTGTMDIFGIRGCNNPCGRGDLTDSGLEIGRIGTGGLDCRLIFHLKLKKDLMSLLNTNYFDGHQVT